MSTSLHAVFNLIFDNLYFVMAIFIIHCRKVRFSESSQNSTSEKSIFGHLRSFSSTYKFFPGRGRLFHVSTIQGKFFERKDELSTWSQKNNQFSAKVPILAIFDYLGPP